MPDRAHMADTAQALFLLRKWPRKLPTDSKNVWESVVVKVTTANLPSGRSRRNLLWLDVLLHTVFKYCSLYRVAEHVRTWCLGCSMLDWWTCVALVRASHIEQRTVKPKPSWLHSLLSLLALQRYGTLDSHKLTEGGDTGSRSPQTSSQIWHLFGISY